MSVWSDDDAPEEPPAILAAAAAAFHDAGVNADGPRMVRTAEGDWVVTAKSAEDEAQDMAMRFTSWLRNLGFGPGDLNEVQTRKLRAKFDAEQARGRDVAARAESEAIAEEPQGLPALLAQLPEPYRGELLAELEEIRREALQEARRRRGALPRTATPGDVALYEIRRALARGQTENP